MFVTVTRNKDSVTVTSSEPLDSGLLAQIAIRSQVRTFGIPNGTPVRFLAQFVSSKHADHTSGPIHSLELGDMVRSGVTP